MKSEYVFALNGNCSKRSQPSSCDTHQTTEFFGSSTTQLRWSHSSSYFDTATTKSVRTCLTVFISSFSNASYSTQSSEILILKPVLRGISIWSARCAFISSVKIQSDFSVYFGFRELFKFINERLSIVCNIFIFLYTANQLEIFLRNYGKDHHKNTRADSRHPKSIKTYEFRS